MGKKISIATVVRTTTQRLTAIKHHIEDGGTAVFIDGQPLTVDTIAAAFQGSVDAQAAVTSAKGRYKVLLNERAAADDLRRRYDEGMKMYVLSRFGANSEAAHDFGYAPRKIGEADVATKAQAVLLSKATREARGTMGKKQRLKIKGTLPSPDATTDDVAKP